MLDGRHSGPSDAGEGVPRLRENELEYPGSDGRYYHRGVPFAGVMYSLYRTGELRTETEYRDGVPWGRHRRYHRGGGLEREENDIAGHREGYQRRWHPNGQLASEEWCHLGLALARRKWDPEGNLVEEFVRPEADPHFQCMLDYRRAWGVGEQPVPDTPPVSEQRHAEPGAAPDLPSDF